ncbi:MAG TPA: Ppx/GppA phosphatase family protein [Ensifer sp.]|nr:Ppx/GppA phosphatase family protein [Ensifer sp.]
MEDPSNGSKPSFDGAFDRAGSPGKQISRRGRRRRSGKNRAASAPQAKGQPPVKTGETERLDSPSGSPGNDVVRKRKRRRKKSGPAHPTPQQQQASQSQENNGSGSRKKQQRNRRSLQGRPLSTTSDRTAAAAARVQPQHEARPQQQAERAPAPPPSDLYAALDLGTNNCRLLIAQPTRPGQFRVVDAFSRIVRLGEGLGSSGRLSADAMERSIEALKICAAKLSTRNIRKRRLIATEACRAAVNGEEFLERVTAETGLELEIINRETEARLAVSGCSSLVGRETRSVVLFDIGGGSSEIAVIKTGENRSARLANHITHWTSLPVGVVTLSERHGGRDVTPAVFDAMVSEVEGMLARFDSPDVSELADNPDSGFHLIGTSGTVTTLAGVHLGLSKYDRRKVDGVWLSDAEVSAMQAKLLSWDFAGRASNPCIGPDRADLVLAGCAILEAIRRRWPSPRMRVADRGLREGLLTDMMADDGVWRRLRHRGGLAHWRGRPGDKT